MIFKHVDNIFDIYPETIIHPVNCVGLCHDPLSKKIKKIWPDYFREYSRECIRKKLEPHKAFLYSVGSLFGTRFIITLPIRNHWQENLSRDSLQKSILELLKICDSEKLETLSIPKIEGIPASWLEQELISQNKKGKCSFLKLIYIFPNE